MKEMRQSQIMITLASWLLCASTGVLATSTQLRSIEQPNESIGASWQRRLKRETRRRVVKDAIASDVVEGENILLLRSVLKGQAATSLRRMNEFGITDDTSYIHDNNNSVRSLAGSKTTTTTTTKTTTVTGNGATTKTSSGNKKQSQKKKNGFTHAKKKNSSGNSKKNSNSSKKKNGNKGTKTGSKNKGMNTKTGGGGVNELKLPLNVNVNVDVNIDGGYAPGTNKHTGQSNIGGHAPGINKQKGQSSPKHGGSNSMNIAGFDGACNTAADCLTMNECCSIYGFCGTGPNYCSGVNKGSSVKAGHAPGSNKHSGNAPGINKQKGMSKTPRYNSKQQSDGAKKGSGGMNMCPCPTTDGHHGRELTNNVVAAAGWWAPPPLPPMCPCPTDTPTYHPTSVEQLTEPPTVAPSGEPSRVPSGMPSFVPTFFPTTNSPTKAIAGCPWYYWGGKEGMGLAVGDVQETPEIQLQQVIDLSTGSRHTFIIEEGGIVYVSGFVESLSAYQGHLGIMRDRVSEGPNGYRSINAVVDSANKTISSPQFAQAYAGAGAPADSRAMHSLLIDRAGHVYTTGNNNKGQLCLGDMDSRDMFHNVSSLPGTAKAAAVGLDFTLILLSDGRVFGCGNNEQGELGLGPNMTHSAFPDNGNGLTGITSISAGLSFSLYLQADGLLGRVDKGKVFGSGSNLYSQLCNSTGGDKITVPKELDVGIVRSVQAGRESTYFLYENGSVKSCGRNDQGQLGDGTFKDSNKPVKLDLPENMTINNIVSGPSSASIFFSSGVDLVYGAGQNYQFQLGLGNIGSQNVPTMIDFDADLYEIVKISSSGTHTVAISCPIETTMPTMAPTELPTVVPTSMPTVLPTVQPTGLPTTEPTSEPTFLPTAESTDEPTDEPTSAPTLAPTVTTDEPTFLPTTSPTLLAVNWYFWGAEEGRGNTLGDNVQVPEEIVAEITDVSAGSRHVFLIQDDGTAVASGFIESGAGYRGHLGLGPVAAGCTDRDFTRKLCEGNNVPSTIEEVVDASGKAVPAPTFKHAYAGVGVASDSGAMHSLLISQDGKAYISGSNSKGQLCLGELDTTYVDYFHEVKGIDNVVKGAVGEDFTLLVTESGDVYGCGSNEVSQIGEGPDVFDSPTIIKGALNGITDVATGLGFAIYLNGETGETWGSGSNIYGQLCGFTEGTPVVIPEIVFEGVSEKVIQIEASRESSYFLFENGVARSCGRNDEGQLGNGNSINTSEEEPVVTVDLSETILQLGSGPSSQNIFFIGADGVWASGLNDRYQLGIDEIGSVTKPVPVKFDGPVEIEFISSSGSHTVANGRYL